MSRTSERARVVAYTRVDQSTGNGFVLLLLSVEGQGGWFVQEPDETTDCITSFKKLDGVLSEAEAVPNPVHVRVGEPQIYAFVDGAVVHVGTKADLEPTLRAFVQRNPASIAAALQVFQMVGTPAERRNARSRMRNAIERSLGNKAASSFYTSSLESAFWTKLVSSWRLATNPSRYNSLRSRFKVLLNDEGKMRIEGVEPIDPQERDLLNEIISELEMEFEIFDLPSKEVLPSASFLALSSLETIKHTARQEERVAMILLEILKDREIGADLLHKYQPRAAFERYAIAHTMAAFARLPDPFDDRELVVSTLIYDLYSKTFPLNRGHLLEYLAKHLAMYPRVNRTIEAKLKDTKSVYVHRHAREIMANLEKYR